MRALSASAPLLTALLCLGLASPAMAQPTPTRQGVHFAVGVGASSVSATCDVCTVDFVNDRVEGFSGVLQLGGFVTPRFAITGEFSGWIGNTDISDNRTVSLSLLALGYPSASAGFFLKAGAGVTRAVADGKDSGGDYLGVWLRTDAFVSQFGLGYDVPLGAASLTPYVTYTYAFYGESVVNDVLVDTVFPNALQVGLALTVH